MPWPLFALATLYPFTTRWGSMDPHEIATLSFSLMLNRTALPQPSVQGTHVHVYISGGGALDMSQYLSLRGFYSCTALREWARYSTCTCTCCTCISACLLFLHFITHVLQWVCPADDYSVEEVINPSLVCTLFVTSYPDQPLACSTQGVGCTWCDECDCMCWNVNVVLWNVGTSVM